MCGTVEKSSESTRRLLSLIGNSQFNQSINQSAFIYLLAPLRGSVAITNNDIVLLKAKTNSTKN